MATRRHDLAILFPGQGVGRPGDARSRRARSAPTCSTLAGELVGDDPFARIAEGTRFAQPAIYCASLAGFERARRARPAAAYAGHSLGEIAALAAAGARRRARRAADRRRARPADGARGRRAPSRAGCSRSAASASQALALAQRDAGSRSRTRTRPSSSSSAAPRRGSSAARGEARGLGLRVEAARRSPAPFTRRTMEPAVEPFRDCACRDRVRPAGAPVISGAHRVAVRARSPRAARRLADQPGPLGRGAAPPATPTASAAFSTSGRAGCWPGSCRGPSTTPRS